MPTINLFNRANRNSGTRNFGPVTIPQGVSRIVITASRENWPVVQGNLVTFTADISFDGGATWQLLVGFTAAGGTITGPDGQIAANSVVDIRVPQPELAGKLIRATLTNAATFRTQVDVETF